MDRWMDIALLRGMMRMDPVARFTFDEIRRHPWFTRYVVFMLRLFFLFSRSTC